MVLPPVGWKHCATLQGGTHSGDHAWYTFRRLCLVYIQAIMPGSHSGGYDWYILARSMTQVWCDAFHPHLCRGLLAHTASLSYGPESLETVPQFRKKNLLETNENLLQRNRNLLLTNKNLLQRKRNLLQSNRNLLQRNRNLLETNRYYLGLFL